MEVRKPNEYETEQKNIAAQSLARDRVTLLIAQPFIGMLAMRLEMVPVWDSRCQTACTDGTSVFVNAGFYNHLKPGQRVMLLAHEIWHVVYLHFLRRENRDRGLFNIACDMEVNRMLQENGMEMIRGCLLPPPWHSTENAEQLYEWLKKEENRKELNGKEACLDEHYEPGDHINSFAKGNEKIFDADFQVQFSKDTAESIREMINDARGEYVRKYGNLPGDLEKIVAPLCKPRINWREKLAQFVTSCFNGDRRWLPPNRRFVHQGLYLQSRRGTRLNAVVALDTSGSTIAGLDLFVAEINGLIRSFGEYELTVIQCDAKIQSVQTYTPDSPMPEEKLKIRGGGGTDFRPVFSYVEKNLPETQILIYLTDGYGDAPKTAPSYPVLWCLPDFGKAPAPWGEICQLPTQKM